MNFSTHIPPYDRVRAKHTHRENEREKWLKLSTQYWNNRVHFHLADKNHLLSIYVYLNWKKRCALKWFSLGCVSNRGYIYIYIWKMSLAFHRLRDSFFRHFHILTAFRFFTEVLFALLRLKCALVVRTSERESAREKDTYSLTKAMQQRRIHEQKQKNLYGIDVYVYVSKCICSTKTSVKLIKECLFVPFWNFRNIWRHALVISTLYYNRHNAIYILHVPRQQIPFEWIYIVLIHTQGVWRARDSNSKNICVIITLANESRYVNLYALC